MDSAIEIINLHGWKIAVLTFLLKEGWVILKGERKKLADTMEQVKIAVAELRIHVSYLKSDRQRAAKLALDVDRAFEEIRKLKSPRSN